jgi:hypothetical protein
MKSFDELEPIKVHFEIQVVSNLSVTHDMTIVVSSRLRYATSARQHETRVPGSYTMKRGIAADNRSGYRVYFTFGRRDIYRQPWKVRWSLRSPSREQVTMEYVMQFTDFPCLSTWRSELKWVGLKRTERCSKEERLTIRDERW